MQTAASPKGAIRITPARCASTAGKIVSATGRSRVRSGTQARKGGIDAQASASRNAYAREMTFGKSACVRSAKPAEKP
ncbi:hypothetical protein, partial [Burkholderia thailandensis]|uniref:hypothetical protein n=1 Tax=Burkholderia thailandensis TaxID=57975 RepID=UPI00217E6DEB